MCRRAYNDAGCSDRWVRYAGIEDVLTIDIDEIINRCPKPALTNEARSHMLKQIRIRLWTLRERRASMVAEHAGIRQSLRPVLEARQSVEAEIGRLLNERKRLRIDRPKWLDITLSARLDKLRTVAKATVVDRVELHSVLRSLFTHVVVDWEHDQLVIHWKHGGTSNVPVSMKPQRVVANRRRSDRRRFQPGEMAPALPVVPR